MPFGLPFLGTVLVILTQGFLSSFSKEALLFLNDVFFLPLFFFFFFGFVSPVAFPKAAAGLLREGFPKPKAACNSSFSKAMSCPGLLLAIEVAGAAAALTVCSFCGEPSSLLWNMTGKPLASMLTPLSSFFHFLLGSYGTKAVELEALLFAFSKAFLSSSKGFAFSKAFFWFSTAFALSKAQDRSNSFKPLCS